MSLPLKVLLSLEYLADKGDKNDGGSDPLTPKPPVSLPGSLGAASDRLIGWSLTAALVACMLGFIWGSALVGVGNNTERPDMAARGKRSMLWSLVAAGAIGGVFALVAAFYNLGQGK
ncbi:hypothetical protein ACFT8W_20810 [Streptomyces hygroscopicus]|uniref:hypothetical protein n=1 Tax=Streptomyces hygroscopicus TaxID=1912 RepID=UPI00363162F1